MKWRLSVKDLKMEKCTVKKNKDNYGLQLIKDKAQNILLQINTKIQMIFLKIKQSKMRLLQINALEQEMVLNNRYFGKFLLSSS
jgi:hypothetical protein